MGLKSTIQPSRRATILPVVRSAPSCKWSDRTSFMTSGENDGEIVCLVDDDLSVLKSIQRLLTSDGLAVRGFNKPKEFLSHVRTNPVPVVILDIWMEEMSGLELQAHLSGISPRTRVIIITGRDDPAAKLAALQLGVVAFFTKPFDDDKFLGAVRGALAMRPI
jgi:two-component system response regulator FixJ